MGETVWQVTGAVLIGCGVALQFADLYRERLSGRLGHPALGALLRSRVFQLVAGFALVALGITMISPGTGA